MKRSLLLAAAVACVASAALAGILGSDVKTTLPTIIPASSSSQVTLQLGPTSTAAPATVYECMTPGSSFLATNATSPTDGLPYDEYGDDCHMATSGTLTEFTIGYFEGAAASVDALITFYTNDAADGIIGAVVAGPYLVTGMPGGFVTATITPPDSPMIPANVWFAVQFSPGTAGLVIAGGPPTVGTSHDVFVDTGLYTPPPGLVFFSGNPVANFMIAIETDTPPVPVEVSTWGKIKAQYRD